MPVKRPVAFPPISATAYTAGKPVPLPVWALATPRIPDLLASVETKVFFEKALWPSLSVNNAGPLQIF